MANKQKRRIRKVRTDGRSEGQSRFVMLYHWLIRSPAYESLRCVERSLLVELYALYNGSNNGDLFLSVREAARRLNVAPATTCRAFKVLESKGFIRARQRSSFQWKKRLATCWVLTEFEYAGKLPSKEFMSWQPVEKTEPGISDETVGASGETVPAKCPIKKPLTVHEVKPSTAISTSSRSHEKHTYSLPGRGADNGKASNEAKPVSAPISDADTAPIDPLETPDFLKRPRKSSGYSNGGLP